jgi:hypothetical protein
LLDSTIKRIKEQPDWGVVTAMRQPVQPQDAIAISEAIIYLIKKEK